MENNKSAIEFPCYFPIKIIGKNTETFEAEIAKIVHEHFPGIPAPQLVRKQSNKNTYIAITATVFVHDKRSLDELYQALTKHPDIKMVL